MSLLLCRLSISLSTVLSNRRGLALVEYALLAALVAIVAIAALTTLGTTTRAKLTTVASTLNPASPGSNR